MTIETELSSEEQRFFETNGEESVETKQEENKEDVKEEQEVKEETHEDEKEKKFVPHGAFHEERQKRKEMEQRLEAEKIQRAKLEERLNILAETVKQRQSQESPIPSFEEDPANHLKMTAEQERARVANMERSLQEQQQRIAQEQQERAFLQAYQSRAAEFSAKVPEFQEAYKHALNTRIEEYKTMGHTHEEAVRFTTNDERAIAMNAMQRGLNPAEVLYNLAKQRGFSARAQAQDLSSVQKGVQASKSIGQVSGRTQAGKLSLEAIANMSDEEFNEATKGNNWAKLWG